MVIIFILLLAIFLRLINLSQSLWLDEAVQAITAQSSFSYIFQEITGDFHPPLYHFLMHFWVAFFGSSEVVLRLPSVIFGVGTIFFVYKIGNLIYPRFLGYLGALFLATAPFHIYYSQEARMYSMVTFFVTGSFYYFLKIIDENKRKINRGNCELYFLFILLALYTDYYAFLALLVQSIIFIIKKRYRFVILNSCLPVGMALFLILFYLPWLPMFLVQLKTGALATKGLPGWGELVNVSFIKAIPLTFAKFSMGRVTIFNKLLYGGAVLILGIVYGSLMLKFLRGLLKDRFKDIKGAVLAAWLIFPFGVAWIFSLWVPNFQPFRLLLILPAFYLLLSGGILTIKNVKLQASAVFFILVVNVFFNFYFISNPFFYREDWRGLVNFLREQNNASIILPSETSNWPIRYYDSEKKINVVYGENKAGRVEDLRNLGSLENKIYYIRYLVPLFDPNELILADLNLRGYTKVREVSFNQIPLWEFEKK